MNFRRYQMKCVFTVAGLGTRLLPVTKELPKEMLPMYDISSNKKIILKPFLQLIYEKLYNFGINDYCFVVGRSKRAVQDHFTPNFDLIKDLKKMKKNEIAKDLNVFFKNLDNSNIVFVYQPKPIGFGDAIYRSKNFVGDEPFLLHAGDDIVLSKNNSHLHRLKKYFLKYDAEIACLIEDVKDPRKYGVIEGKILEKNVIKIDSVVEKPKKPKSNSAVIAIYIFKPSIFNYLKKVKNTGSPEQQLARAINMSLKKNTAIGIKIKKNEKRLDVGTPESYLNVLHNYKQLLRYV